MPLPLSQPASPRPIRAYVVSCPDDDHGSEVVFADTASHARGLHSGETCDCGYMNLTAKRAPHLDKYSPGPVSLRTLVEDFGWFVFCANCEKPVYGDEPEVVWRDENSAFCSHKCQRKLEAREVEFRKRMERLKVTTNPLPAAPPDGGAR